MDKLEITALSISTHIGIHAWEKRILQQVLIDISLPVDCAKANDDLANSIDYDALCKKVTSFVEANTFNLIETVAEKVAQLIKDEFKVAQLTIKVSKPNAVKNAGNISVVIAR
jgi:dihydroneopterin aldolase